RRKTQDPVPASALDDIRKALELGPVNHALAFDAAGLLAATFRLDPTQTPQAQARALELREEAYQWIEQALLLGADPKGLHFDANFNSLRQEPRFQVFMKKEKVKIDRTREIRIDDPVDSE